MFSVVTGGAGFIGSHLVDALVARGDRVTVIDNLSAGTRDNLAGHLEKGRVTLVTADLLAQGGWESHLEGAAMVYHLAADPDVRQSAVTPERQVQENIVATARVLEAMREHRVPALAFTSTSTVYGEASVIPTPEEYTPLQPISVYGATKLACEALISAYSHSYGIRSVSFRFANIIGPRSGHGVIPDFVRKLRENPRELEILGDGSQTKSYLDVSECVRGMLFAVEHARDQVNVYNIGSEDWIDVTAIADIVVRALGLSRVKYRYTGGERGWVGDVPRMLLAIEKLKSLGWKPQMGSRESVVSAAHAMAGEG
ncbi:MAG: NAD-dependent epimerase/dehydratase family protein [Methanomicrobiales archaeon]|nr:NAD-dependent epimerase/dehydratase family protein [Methanomicrobiales archaeon]